MNSSQIGFGSGLPYTSSKHVVTLISEALFHELRSTPDCKVRAAVLCPAGVATNFANNAARATAAGDDAHTGVNQMSPRVVSLSQKRGKSCPTWARSVPVVRQGLETCCPEGGPRRS